MEKVQQKQFFQLHYNLYNTIVFMVKLLVVRWCVSVCRRLESRVPKRHLFIATLLKMATRWRQTKRASMDECDTYTHFWALGMEWNTDKCCEMDEHGQYYAKWNKLDVDNYLAGDSTYMRYLEEGNSQSRTEARGTRIGYNRLG